MRGRDFRHADAQAGSGSARAADHSRSAGSQSVEPARHGRGVGHQPHHALQEDEAARAGRHARGEPAVSMAGRSFLPGRTILRCAIEQCGVFLDFTHISPSRQEGPTWPCRNAIVSRRSFLPGRTIVRRATGRLCVFPWIITQLSFPAERTCWGFWRPVKGNCWLNRGRKTRATANSRDSAVFSCKNHLQRGLAEHQIGRNTWMRLNERASGAILRG